MHFAKRFPGSLHYSPDKVVSGRHVNGKRPYGSIYVDVPGVSRAYENKNIRPKIRKYLAIPFNVANNKKPSSFLDSFVFTNKKGKKFIVQNNGGSLTFLFSLVSRVF